MLLLQKRRWLFSICFSLVVINCSWGQILPNNLNCTDSRTWIKNNYYDNIHITLGYQVARKKMYAYIDNHNDTIECVYSGYTVINPHGNEITYPAPINTEHTVPQSFFNSMDPMVSDIYHLFPAYDMWNSYRANNPFTDIPDNLTVNWMLLGSSQSNIPQTNIDAYSEQRPIDFEPRESHKGDLARAVAYFYTVYPSVGNITDVISISTLLLWNAQDPVDAKEMARNNMVQVYQGNRNPFIDYPSWIVQAFVCNTGIDNDATHTPTILLSPSPANLSIQIQLTNMKEAGQIHLCNMQGQIIHSFAFDIYQNTWHVDVSGWPAGIYSAQVVTNSGTITTKFLVAHLAFSH